MTLGDLIKHFRVQADDLVAPFLWKDEDVKLYLNDAQKEAAERAFLIFDQTSDLTRLSFTADNGIIELDGRVLKVQRAIVDAPNKRSLERTTRERLDSDCPGWETAGSSEPREFLDDVTTITLVRAPSYDGTLKLAVYRLPMEDMADTDDEPEINARHHLRMVDWALYRAFNKRDSDAYDPKKAAGFEASFTASFGVRRDANVQRKQREGKDSAVQMNPSW